VVTITGGSLKIKNTGHQVGRSAMPDTDAFNRMYLIKNVSRLRATYQIKLLTFKAIDHKMQLIIRVPTSCVFDSSLNDLAKKCGKSVSRGNY